MKKLITVIAGMAIALGMSGCGEVSVSNEVKEIPVIEPSELVTADDVASIAGYTPVMQPEDSTRPNTRGVLYRSEPIGQNDTVKVMVTQFDDNMDYRQIFNIYEDQKNRRQDMEMVESLGQEAYIAIPTIYVYDRGCLIEITAGSGNDETQRGMLKNFAFTAAGRLEEIVPEYKGN